jgi:hypothetical protein
MKKNKPEYDSKKWAPNRKKLSVIFLFYIKTAFFRSGEADVCTNWGASLAYTFLSLLWGPVRSCFLVLLRVQWWTLDNLVQNQGTINHSNSTASIGRQYGEFTKTDILRKKV